MNNLNKDTELDKSEVYRKLLDACDTGNLADVKHILTSPEFKDCAEIINYDSGLCLFNACENGHLEIVKFILTSTELKEKYDMKFNFDVDEEERDAPLRIACSNGHLEVVKYLLTSPDLPIKYPTKNISSSAISDASFGGQLEILKYLVSDDLPSDKKLDLDEYILEGLKSACLKNNNNHIVKFFLDYLKNNYHAACKTDLNDIFKTIASKNNFDCLKLLISSIFDKNGFLSYSKKETKKSYLNNALGSAAASGNIDIVKYLLESDKLKEYITPSVAVNRASYTNKLEILEYVIIELNIPKSNDIDEFLKIHPNNIVEHMFKIRDLNRELNSQLTIKDTASKSKKI